MTPRRAILTAGLALVASHGLAAVEVFDQKGLPVPGERYQDGPTAAAGVIAQTSGRYFVRVTLTKGEKADFCLVYSYK